jgi:hypothetical protein
MQPPRAERFDQPLPRVGAEREIGARDEVPWVDGSSREGGRQDCGIKVFEFPQHREVVVASQRGGPPEYPRDRDDGVEPVCQPPGRIASISRRAKRNGSAAASADGVPVVLSISARALGHNWLARGITPIAISGAMTFGRRIAGARPR